MFKDVGVVASVKAVAITEHGKGVPVSKNRPVFGAHKSVSDSIPKRGRRRESVTFLIEIPTLNPMLHTLCKAPVERFLNSLTRTARMTNPLLTPFELPPFLKFSRNMSFQP